MHALRYSKVESSNLSLSATRGIAGSKEIFYRRRGLDIELANSLPYPSEIDKKAFVGFLARTQLFGIYDVDISDSTLVPGWNRVPDCSEVTFEKRSAALVVTEHSPWDAYVEERRSFRDEIEGCRHAFLQSLRDIIGEADRISCEFSGGIDSGMVLSGLMRCCLNAQIYALSVRYPFYEFRIENEYRENLARVLQISPKYLSVERCLPYSDLHLVRPHAVPSLASTAYGFLHQVQNYFPRGGSTAHVNGHGGDRLFLTNPFLPYSSVFGGRPAWLSNRVYKDCQEQFNVLQLKFNRHDFFLRPASWDFSLIEPPWCNAASGFQNTSSPFLNMDFVFCLRRVVERLPKDFDRSRKALARLIFGDFLPDFVWERPGKVDHIGCAYRGCILNGEKISHVARDIYIISQDVGIDATGFMKETQSIIEGRISASSMWGAVISLLIWLRKLRGANEGDCISVE